MKKIIAAALLGLLAAFIIADLAKDNDKSNTKTETPAKRETPATTAPETTSEDDFNAEKALACLDASNSIEDGLTAMSDGFELLPYADEAEQREFLATAREFISTSIQAMQLCAEFAPAEAAETISALRQLDNAIESYEDLL